METTSDLDISSPVCNRPTKDIQKRTVNAGQRQSSRRHAVTFSEEAISCRREKRIDDVSGNQVKASFQSAELFLPGRWTDT